MTSAFITKKISNTATLGERLKTARLEQSLSLEEVEESTKIKLRYLEALENDDYTGLPTSTYVKCFIRTYGRILGLPVSELLTQYRHTGEFISSKNAQKASTDSNLRKPIFVLTPARIASFVIGLLILGFGSYLWYEVSGFTASPEIVLDSPRTSKTEVAASSIIVEGRTDPGATLTLNQQYLGTDTEGKFKEEVWLKDGANVLEFASKNKLGRESTKTITVIAKAPDFSDTKTLGLQDGAGLSLILEAGPNPTWVTITADDKKVFRGVMLTKTKQQFYAFKTLVIDTTNAGSLKLKLNGKNLGKAGPEGESKQLEFESSSLDLI
jgi:cytoskeletal protein RodZ